ncbi:MAG: hypothetical protein GY820_40450 [Gammaproteobacteria bacterium]|nr:hypothetical protein [Gammaproteobacteria bacterium]
MQTLKYAVTFFLSFLVTSTFAYPRHDPNVYDGGNLWTITFHNDDSVAHTQWATQRICFLPYTAPGAGQTQIKGRWYSTSYPNWHGHYRQEGDSVKMVGNFWNGYGNDGITFDIVTSHPHTGLRYKHYTVGAGHWNEWGDNGRFGSVFGFGNTILERVGKCLTFSDIALSTSTREAEALDTTGEAFDIDIKDRILEDGSVARYPQQPGQLPLEGANYLEELFIDE